jgi:AraC-like DNA-binding protein
MEHYLFLTASSIFIMGCFCMAIAFLVVPLSPDKRLKKYHISLRFLSATYFITAVLKLIDMKLDGAMLDLISIQTIVIASLQAPVFTFSLITLITPRFVTRSYLWKHLMPVFILIVLYVLVALVWGNPKISSFVILKLVASHPAVLVRGLFLVYYVLQLLFLYRLFCVQVKKYEERLDNYIADRQYSYLSGVRYLFYAMLVVGVCTLLSCFMLTEPLLLIFSIVYTVFYMVFGLYYIRYPHKFANMQQIIYPLPSFTESSTKDLKRFYWTELKNHIIADKYYERPGVNIEEIAQHLKIGRTTLSNFINCEEGLNFNAWINLLRVEEAQRLLSESPDCNFAEIAKQVGYREPSSFSREFKRITAKSPSAWRQNR